MPPDARPYTGDPTTGRRVPPGHRPAWVRLSDRWHWAWVSMWWALPDGWVASLDVRTGVTTAPKRVEVVYDPGALLPRDEYDPAPPAD